MGSRSRPPDTQVTSVGLVLSSMDKELMWISAVNAHPRTLD